MHTQSSVTGTVGQPTEDQYKLLEGFPTDEQWDTFALGTAQTEPDQWSDYGSTFFDQELDEADSESSCSEFSDIELPEDIPADDENAVAGEILSQFRKYRRAWRKLKGRYPRDRQGLARRPSGRFSKRRPSKGARKKGSLTVPTQCL